MRGRHEEGNVKLRAFLAGLALADLDGGADFVQPVCLAGGNLQVSCR